MLILVIRVTSLMVDWNFGDDWPKNQPGYTAANTTEVIPRRFAF